MSKEPKPGDLRVWWIPQAPGKSFLVNVPTFDEAKRLIETLAQYDLFQYENRIKPDYNNAGGIEIFVLDGAEDRTPGWIGCDDEEDYDYYASKAESRTPESDQI